MLRDVALLARIPRAGVSFTVTTADESVRRRFEPDSPRIERRIATLAALRAAGLPVQAAIAPLLPGDPARLAELLDPVVDRVVVDDFFRGDGAGGRRSGPALKALREQGFGALGGARLRGRGHGRPAPRARGGAGGRVPGRLQRHVLAGSHRVDIVIHGDTNGRSRPEDP